MRELKFRAWHKRHKEMLEVAAISFMSAVSAGFIVVRGSAATWTFDEVDLLQFTGLKDKQGKEIYEGNILLYRWPSGKGQNIYTAKIGYSLHALDDYGETFAYTGVYFLDHETGKPISGCWHPPLDQLEIIGNIYETPELLESH